MRYVIARIKQIRRDEAYRIYVTDCLKILTRADERYADWIAPQPHEARTADQIIGDISAGLSRIGG